MLSFQQQAQLLAQLQTPVWIYDTLNYRIAWANEAGLQLWDSPHLQELSSRDFRLDMSRAVYLTLCQYLEEFRQGERLLKWWTLTPHGQPKRVLCQFSGIVMEDGHMAMLCEAPYQELASPAPARSASQSTMVALFGPQQQLISSNPIFNQTFRYQISQLRDLLEEDAECRFVLNQLQNHPVQINERVLSTSIGKRWHRLEFRYLDNHRSQLLLQAEDIHEQKVQEALAHRDSLTGLLSQPDFFAISTRQIASHAQLTLWRCQNWSAWQQSVGLSRSLRTIKLLADSLQQYLPALSPCTYLGKGDFLAVITPSTYTDRRYDTQLLAQAWIPARDNLGSPLRCPDYQCQQIPLAEHQFDLARAFDLLHQN